MARCLAIAAALFLFVYSTPASSGDDDPALRKQFLDGVAHIERSLQHLSFRARCTLRSRLVSASPETRAALAKSHKDPFEEDVYEFACAFRGHLVLQRLKNKRGLEEVRVRNRSYAFMMTSPPTGGVPALQFLERMGASPSTDSKITEIEQEARAVALSGFYFIKHPLPTVFQSKDLQLHRVYSVQAHDGKRLVRAEFDWTAHDSPRTGFDALYTNAFVICDPSNHWAMTEYGTQHYLEINKSRGEHHFQLEYGDASEGIPVATRIVHTLTYLNQDSTDSGTTWQAIRVVDPYSKDQVPEEEFYLSFYGLPEPNFSGTWAGPWVWYLVGGIACLVIGAIILKRRKARA
jgi:hypothetical protein